MRRDYQQKEERQGVPEVPASKDFDKWEKDYQHIKYVNNRIQLLSGMYDPANFTQLLRDSLLPSEMQEHPSSVIEALKGTIKDRDEVISTLRLEVKNLTEKLDLYYEQQEGSSQLEKSYYDPVPYVKSSQRVPKWLIAILIFVAIFLYKVFFLSQPNT